MKKIDASTRRISFRPALRPVASAVGAALVALFGAPFHAAAAPTGGQVAAGAATIQQSGTQTVINQATQRTAINWQSFGITANEAVIFRQPSSSSVALNRVVGRDPSAIYGSLQANGHVFLINPNGVLFARGANVDVAGLVASTLGMSNNDFMAGRYVFSGGSGAGAVINQGTIRAKDGGYVALLGNQVFNTGTIVASNGKVALGAGESMVLDFHGDGLLSLKVNASAAKAKIENSGEIHAAGGAVIMSAAAKNALLDTVLNVDGIVTAKGIVERGGHIYLDGGRSGVTQVTGTLDTSNAQGKGGEIRVLGENVGLVGKAKLDASGTTGGGTVLVGGDYQGRNPDIANAQRTFVGRDVTLDADATVKGDGGKVIVWADDATRFYGNISARGGNEGGNGGFAEVSGKDYLDFRGRADLGAPRGQGGTLLLDPSDITITRVTTTAGDESTGGTFGGGVFTPTLAAATADIDAIESALNSGTSVDIRTNSGAAGFGDITILAGETISKTGPGTATLRLNAERHIVVQQGVTIQQSSGTPGVDTLNIVFNADSDGINGGRIDLQGVSNAPGDRIEFITNGGNISLGGRDISLTGAVTGVGRFASGDATNGDGVRVFFTFLDAGDGSVSIAGQGGSAASSNHGVFIADGSVSANGGVTISGTGGTDGDGIRFVGSSQISSTTPVSGAGSISLTGIGGPGTSNISGIFLQNSSITSVAGDISITGTGGGAGGGSEGVLLDGTVISQTGTISITGTPGGTTQHGIGALGSASIQSATGAAPITLTADDMDVGFISSPGTVTLRPLTANRAIDLGTDTVGTLGLTSAEIDRITAGTLVIGRNDAGNEAGSITVTAPIAPAGTSRLSLRSGAAVSQNAGATITVSELAVAAGGAVTLDQSNNVSRIAGSADDGNSFSFVDNAPALTIDDIDGVQGILTRGGTVTVTNSGSLTLGPIFIRTTPNTASPSAGGNVFLTAGDAITIGGFIAAVGQTASIGAPDTGGAGGEVLVRHTNAVANRPITLNAFRQIDATGGAAADGFDTSGNGGIVTIVNESGNIVLNGSILTPDGAFLTAGATAGNGGAIQLRTASAGNTITQAATGSRLQTTQGAVSAVNGQLLVDSTGSVSLTGNGTNYSRTLAARVTDSGATFTYRDGFPLIITTVPAVGSQAGTAGLIQLDGVRTSGGAVAVTASTLSVTQPILTTPPALSGLAGGAVTLTPTGAITTSGAGTITTTGASGANSPDSATAGGTGGKGGDVVLQSTGNGAITLGGTIVTTGGAGGSGFLVDDGDGNFIPVTPGGVSGAGGAVTLQSGGTISLPAGTLLAPTINTSGGTGPNSGGAGGAITLQGPVVLAGNAVLTTAGGAAGGEEGSLVGDGGNIRFASTVNATSAGVEGLTLNPGSGSVSLEGILGGATPLGAINIDSGFNVAGSLDGNTPAAAITASSFTQTAGGGRTHLSSLTVSGGGTPVSIESNQISITGATSATSGGVTLNAGTIDVGSISSVGSIVLTTAAASGSATLGGNLSAAGPGPAITIDHAVSLGADVTVGTTGSGPVTFARSIDSAEGGPARALTINTTGAMTFNGAIGASAPLLSLTASSGAIALNNPVPATGNVTSVTTTGGQTYNGPLTLGANTTMTSTGGGAITFGSTIQSAPDVDTAQNILATLAVNTSGTTTFNADINMSGAELGALSTDAGGITRFAGAGTRTILTHGPQSYGDAVELAANTLFSLCGCATLPQNITFGSTINADLDANNRTLEIRSDNGIATFSGSVGNSQPLGALAVYAPNIVFDAAAPQVVQLGSGVPGSITLTGAFPGATPTAIRLAQAVSFLSSGSITFNGTIDGTNAGGIITGALETASFGGPTMFGGAIGATTPLVSLITGGTQTFLAGGAVNTTYQQLYEGPVQLLADTTLTNSGTGTGNGASGIYLASTVDSSGGPFSLTANLGGGSLVNFSGNVGATGPLSTLQATLTGVNSFGDAGFVLIDNFSGPVTITTTGAQSYNGAVSLFADTTLISTGGAAIGLNGALNSGNFGPAALTIDNGSGAVTFGGAVGGGGGGFSSLPSPLASITQVGNGPVAVNGGLMSTTGAQSYNGTVTVGGAAGSAVEFFGSSLTFNNATNALIAGNDPATAHPLTLTTDALTLGGPVSGTSTLLIQPTANNAFMVISGDASGNIATLDQLQNGFASIKLGRATATLGGQTGVRAVTFRDPVTIHGFGVFVNGNITGSDNASVTLTPTPGGAGIDLGASIRTSGQAIALNGPVSLITNSVLVDSTCAAGGACTTTPAGADVTFASTIRANSSAAGDRALTVNAGTAGTATFADNIGFVSTTRLADLDVTARTIKLNGATINVNDPNAAAQTVTFNGDVVLGADVTINTNRASGTSNSVTFNGAIDVATDIVNPTAGRALDIDSGNGTVTFNGVIGSTGPLSAFLVAANGITFNTTNVNVNAPGALLSPVVFLDGITSLPLGLTLTTSGHGAGAGSVTFGQINGPGGLNVIAPADVVTFNGPVGVSTPLQDLSVTGNRIEINAATFNLDGGTTARTNVFNGPVVLGVPVVTIDADRATDSDSNVTFAAVNANTTSAARALNVVAGTGTVTFAGNVGTTTGALSDLDVAAGRINLNASTFNLNGGPAVNNLILFNGPVVLGADVTINTNRSGTSNSVTFNGAIDGDNATTGRALAMNSGNGTVTFNGVIGSVGPLSDFDVTASGIALNTTTINVNAPNAATGPTVTLNGITSLADGAVILSTEGHGGGAGSVTFGQIEGPGGLVVRAPADTITFGGSVGATTPLPFLGASGARINLNAATFNLDGDTVAQGNVLTGPMFLGVPVVNIDLDRTGTADSGVSFAGTIDADNGANNRVLNVNAGSGVVTFRNSVGTTGALSGLTVTAGTRIDLNAPTYNINGGTAGGNTIAFNGPVQLNNASLVRINTDRADSPSDNSVSFGSTINSGGAPGHALDVNAGLGSVTVAGTVGATTALTTLTVTGASIDLNAPVNTTGGVTLTGDSMALNGINAAGQTVTLRQLNELRPIVLGDEDGARLSLNAAELSGITAQRLIIGRNDSAFPFNGITIAADVSPNVSTLHLLTNAGVTGTAGGIVMPSGGLAINAAGVNITALNNDVGTLAAAGAVSELTFNDASGLTIGSVDGVTGVTSTNAPIAITAVDNLALGNAVNAGTATGGVANVVLTSTAGNITGNALVTAGTNVALDSQTGIGTGTTGRVNTSAGTLAARSRSSGGVFVSEANSVTLNTVNGVTNSAAGPQGYDLVAGSGVSVSGPVSTGNVDTSTTAGVDATSGGITLVGTSFTGSGTLTTGSATASGATPGPTTAQSGTIRVTSTTGSLRTGRMTTGEATIVGRNGADVAASGDIILSARRSIGPIQPIAFGTASGSSDDRQGQLDLTSNGFDFDFLWVSSSTPVRLRNVTTPVGTPQVVILGAQGNLTIETGGADSGVAGTGNGANGDSLSYSTSSGGNILVNRPITAGDIFFRADGAAALDANLATTNGVTIAGRTLLFRDVTVAGGSGEVAFTGAVDPAAAPVALRVTTSGLTTFGGAVGGSGNALSTLTIDSGPAAVNGGGVITTGAQTYRGVSLGQQAATLTSTGGAAIVFDGAVDGPQSLTVNTAGATTFGGATGTSLASLTTDAAGTTAINGGAITTTGNQLFGDPVTIGANTIVTSSGGNVTFASSLDADSAAANRTMQVNAPLGTVTFSGNVGANAAFADFDVVSSPNTTVFNAPGAGPQTVNVTAGGGNTATFSGGVRLDQNLVVNTGGPTSNSVAFTNGSIETGGATDRTLTLNAGGGNIGLAGAGNAVPLAMLTTNGNLVSFNGAATAQQIFVSANQVTTDPFTGLIRATLPFAGFGGPAALTLSGPPGGGVYGGAGAPLRVDVPGLFVVTPNESRALPTVWLIGDPAKKPMYQFYDDPSRREVVYNAFVGTQLLDYNELREDRERILTIEQAEALESKGARSPDQCTTAGADKDGALLCEGRKETGRQ